MDLVNKNPNSLSDKDRDMQRWQRLIADAADEAQRRVSEVEVLDGRSSHKPKISTIRPKQ